MKKVHIRKNSIAWYAVKFRKPLLVAGLACICAVTVNAIDTAFAEEIEPEPELPQIPVIEYVEPEEEPVKLWNVPLDEDLQLHVVEVAESYGIEPELILAVIGQESSYNPETVGDNGASASLMQVQKRWHSERMEKLGCTDLMNPYENIIVGTDYLAELMEEGSLEWALAAYNGGRSYANKHMNNGNVTKYANEVIARYEELKGLNYHGE